MKTNNNFRILVVDDEEINIELASVYLKEEGYAVSYALSAQKALEGIKKIKIDLILLDINMPDIDGLSLCKKLKEDVQTRDIPVVFLTALSDIEHISKAFEVGGADYITKPFNGVELKARVATQLKSQAYLEEIKHKQAKFAQLSITDHLTKLYNALYFDSQLKLLHKKREGFWFLYITIDRFEKLNTLYGVTKSNKILRLFSKHLKEASPSNAVVARLHGVHFAVAMKNYDKRVVERFYKTLLESVSKEQELWEVVQFFVVFKNIQPQANEPFGNLLKQMDSAMKTLVESGNRYRFI